MINMILLVQTLLLAGISNEDIGPMVCIAYNESKFKSQAINHSNSNGTKDYGLYQINSIWLDECNTTGHRILDIKENIKCAALVYHKQGLTAWVAYKRCS